METVSGLKILKYALVLSGILQTSFIHKPLDIQVIHHESNKALNLAKAIKTLSPHISDEKTLVIAKLIEKHSKNYNIDGPLMLAIIQTESNFNTLAKSSTGDFSLAQINYKIWNQELIRLKKEPLDFKKLKTCPDYALKRMAEILQILSIRYEEDPQWYARYHSKTLKLKKKYAKKVNTHLETINNLLIAEKEISKK